MMYNEVREVRLKAVRYRLEHSTVAHLPARGAVRMLEWAEACAEGRDRAELLALFAATGGVKIIRDACGPMH